MESKIVEFAALSLGFVVCLTTGIVCTFNPTFVQRAERIGPINLEPPFHFLRRYKASPQYIVHVRICGVLALLIALVDLYGLGRLVGR